ncbi:MAG: WecB/TagA/CpsF family glycosyltransferase [Pelolinea sp.]|nr:WecB/TagA/CpsF family glycosyltransferase [Pelolinea sp.]
MTVPILGLNIHATNYQSAIGLILTWSRSGESRSVFAANVHMVMEAYDSPKFQRVVNTADLVTPDGMPLVWIMRRKGYPHQERVYGPTLMLRLLDAAAKEGIPVGFLGSTKDVLQELTVKMKLKFPGLVVGAQIAPPFRPLTAEEDQILIREINGSGIKILFVGLGCPNQEIWIAEHRGKIQAVMIGVGAAFAFHAGMVRQAPLWMQKLGFEWLFRFSQEPRRLWRRYFFTNPRFLFLIVREVWLEKASRLRE